MKWVGVGEALDAENAEEKQRERGGEQSSCGADAVAQLTRSDRASNGKPAIHVPTVEFSAFSPLLLCVLCVPALINGLPQAVSSRGKRDAISSPVKLATHPAGLVNTRMATK